MVFEAQKLVLRFGARYGKDTVTSTVTEKDDLVAQFSLTDVTCCRIEGLRWGLSQADCLPEWAGAGWGQCEMERPRHRP